MKRIIIEVGHPNDVHQFKYLFHELTVIGWEVLFLAKQKDIVIELLNAYRLPYKLLGKTRSSIIGKFFTFFIFSFRHYLFTSNFRPQIVLSRNSPHSSLVSRLLSLPHIGFADTENSGIADKLSLYNVDIVFTSYSFKEHIVDQQFYYPGYIETWYLHPKRFSPNATILNYLGIKKDEPYSILRFVSWKAHHDIGIRGLTDEFKILLVDKLLNYGKVFISSEKRLPSKLEKYRFNLPPEKLHDALYYASFFYGESATIASECAMLSTPAVYIDPHGRGYTDELESKYGLVFNYTLAEKDLQSSLLIIDEVFCSKTFRNKYDANYKRLLDDIIEPVNYIKWFIEGYPESLDILNNNPEYWRYFK